MIIAARRLIDILLLFHTAVLCYPGFSNRRIRQNTFERIRCPRKECSSSETEDVRTRSRTDQHIQLIQGVLLQATINVEKCTKYYTEELKTLLIEGLGVINRNNISRLSKDFKRLEANILEVVVRINEEILRDTEALVTKTNEELQDVVVTLTKQANQKLLADFKTIITSAVGAVPVTIDVLKALALIQDNFNDLIDKVLSAFKKITAIEKALLHKIIKEKKNLQLYAITKLIDEF